MQTSHDGNDADAILSPTPYCFPGLAGEVRPGHIGLARMTLAGTNLGCSGARPDPLGLPGYANLVGPE